MSPKHNKTAQTDFAVVEYSSKSGDIWRHAPGHPNYLEDPAQVIDPTSFGCYVSALVGEHIPLTKLANRSIWRRVAKRLTGSWPSYPLDYFSRFGLLMVVHQLSEASEIVHFLRRLKRAYPKLFIIGVPTQPFGLLRQHLSENQAAKRHFVDYMKYCNIFVTVVKATQPWYEALSKTPVAYLPQIYPVHFAVRFHQPRAKKDKAIFVAGVTERPGITQGFVAAKRLQQQFPNYIIRLTQIPGVPLDMRQLAGSRYEIVPFRPWREHLPWLAKQALTINTDYTLTRGRVQVDCAAVGTPSLGGNSDGQTDLFPKLASTPQTEVADLVAQGRRLLVDSRYYQQLVENAQARLAKYDYEESAARLLMLVKSYRG
jgi:hypothetical protein